RRVPEAQVHGYGRETPDPVAVEQAGSQALHQILDRLPTEAPIRGLHLEVTPVPADSLPDRAVARSVPVDAQGHDLPPGTVPPEGGGYRIEVSDRASELAVPRAIGHEVAEVEAIRQRQAGGVDLTTPDLVRPGEADVSGGLSPHDLGRLAEIDHLLRLREDPAHGAYAAGELAALRDHLGLAADDPGAAVRREIVDGWLSRAGHDP